MGKLLREDEEIKVFIFIMIGGLGTIFSVYGALILNNVLHPDKTNSKDIILKPEEEGVIFYLKHPEIEKLYDLYNLKRKRSDDKFLDFSIDIQEKVLEKELFGVSSQAKEGFKFKLYSSKEGLGECYVGVKISKKAIALNKSKVLNQNISLNECLNKNSETIEIELKTPSIQSDYFVKIGPKVKAVLLKFINQEGSLLKTSKLAERFSKMPTLAALAIENLAETLPKKRLEFLQEGKFIPIYLSNEIKKKAINIGRY